MLKRKRNLDDFSAEIQAHLQLEFERRREQGLSEDDAYAAARRAFGNIMQAEERFYESGRWLWWDHFGQDLRFGLRMLARNPGFTLTVVLTLALSIGANTAIFSLVNALLLKKLPYPHSERLGVIYARSTGSESFDLRRNVDGEQWELLHDTVPSLLSAVSGGRPSGVNLQAGSRVQYLHAGRVSAHYFDVLSIRPILGRNFSEDEDRPHGPKSVILTYESWRAVFGGNANILGQAALLKGDSYTVIGVLPPGVTTPLHADLYISLQPSREGEGVGTNFQAMTRLRDGAGWQQADAEMDRAFHQSQRVQRREKSNPGTKLTYYSVPLQKGQTAEVQPQVLALMLAAGLILLIACANLAGLILVRLLRRTGEIATRQALGASIWQIQRQLWVESLLLALVGGAAGIGVGFAALRGLLLLLPEHFLPVANVPLDSRVLAFTFFVSLLTSMLFGVLPALTARKFDLRSSMVSRTIIGGGGVRLRQGLIAGEVALTVVLLAAAGLLVRTLIHLETLPPGFNPIGILTAKASLDDIRYHDPSAFRKLLNDSLATMRQIPGVQNAAVGLTLPYERALIDGVVLRDGKEAGQEISTDAAYVTPGYFETLQIPVIAGRAFADTDGPDAQRVVVINEAFARQFFHDGNAVGRYLSSHDNRMLVVGVVASTIGSSAARLTDDLAPLTREQMIYRPAAQMDDGKSLAVAHTWFQPSWVVRTSGQVQGLTAQMQSALASADPNLPFSGFYEMKDLMASTLATQRIEVALLAAMGSLALALSGVGIFALVANMVAQRTREIGIRMALGSTVGEAMLQVGRSGMGPALVGVALGLTLSAGALQVMRGAIYGVGLYDAPTVGTVVLTLIVVTLAAATLPTLKIATIDPAKTLREE